MTKRIYCAVLSVSIVVCICAMATVFGVHYRYFDRQLTEELAGEAHYLSLLLQKYDVEVLQCLPQDFGRVTLISPEGQVIFDTMADQSSLDNHGSREEFLQAKEKGKAKIVRRSHTIGEQTVYYALRLSNGSVLRLSSSRSTTAAMLAGMLKPFLLVLLLIVVLAGFLASRISKKIVQPLNQLDLEHPQLNFSYDELAPLLEKLECQQETIRQQLLQAQRQKEEFEMIVNYMQEGLLLVDHSGRILAGNTSAMKLLDIPEDKRLFWASGGESVLSLQKGGEFCKTVENGLSGKHAETLLHLDSGCWRLTANPVMGQGRTEGAVLLFVDETEQQHSEQLRREFTANVSHELKTPLTSISGFAEIMKDGLVQEQDIPKFAGKIFHESQRMIDLVGDIIKISQLDEDMIPDQQQMVDLRKLSDEIADRLREKAQEKNISITVQGQGSIPTVRRIMDEMLYNLCDNAIKYNNEGGRVKISISQAQNQTTISVRDNGIGISPADQRRVFERFYRVDKSHSRQIGGTGLGLSIVKHGAAYLNGRIQLESVPGQGSCFSLIFSE